MEVLRKGRSVLIAILVVCWNFENGYCYMNRSTFDLITVTLHRDIKFMYERPEQMNVDAIFGLNLVEVHTTAVLGHKNAILMSEENRELLKEISKLCERIRVNGTNVLSISAFERMIRPDIWNHTILWRRDAIGGKPNVSSGLIRTNAGFIIYQGTPTEAESDRCFHELVNGNQIFECIVSKRCADMLVRNDTTRGYPLTHRLLYVQTAVALGCREHSEIPFAVLKNKYCADILQDLIDMEAMDFPPPSTDLAMEQIILCGMEGYLEFVTSHYAKLIASWPNSHGCYSAFGFHNERKYRGRRSTGLMDYGCDNHASGIAAGSLSLLIRAAVENNVHEYWR